MTRMEDFLAALEAEPDNAALRLAFADWLEEHGKTAEAAGFREREAQRLSDAQWEMIRHSLLRLISDRQTAGQVRIGIGGFTYYLCEAAPGKAAQLRAALLLRLRRAVARQREFEEGLALLVLRGPYRRTEWQRLGRRVFKARTGSAIGCMLTRKIRQRMTVKASGVDKSQLDNVAENFILDSLCDGRDHSYVDPKTIAEVAKRLRAAVAAFDPWTHPWPTKPFYPAVRARMRAAGFQFADDSQ